jgi:hypothetical protein
MLSTSNSLLFTSCLFSFSCFVYGSCRPFHLFSIYSILKLDTLVTKTVSTLCYVESAVTRVVVFTYPPRSHRTSQYLPLPFPIIFTTSIVHSQYLPTHHFWRTYPQHLHPFENSLCFLFISPLCTWHVHRFICFYILHLLSSALI